MNPDSATLVVPPSALVRRVMGPLTRVLNPLIARVAGRRHIWMAALVYHTGRRSGRSYVTPTGARRCGDVFLVPLTFGTRSDWCRNLLAAGGGRIRWKGRDYVGMDPEAFATDEIRPLVNATFAAPMRAGFRLLGIRCFLRLSPSIADNCRSCLVSALHPLLEDRHLRRGPQLFPRAGGRHRTGGYRLVDRVGLGGVAHVRVVVQQDAESLHVVDVHLRKHREDVRVEAHGRRCGFLLMCAHPWSPPVTPSLMAVTARAYYQRQAWPGGVSAGQGAVSRPRVQLGGPPAIPGDHGTVGTERFTQWLQFPRTWHRHLPRQPVSTANPQIPGRPDVQAAELKDEEHPGGPGPDAAHRRQAGGHLLGAHPGETARGQDHSPVEDLGGKVTKGRHLVGRQPDRPECLRGQSKQPLGFHRAVQRCSQGAGDGGRGWPGQLLVDDRAPPGRQMRGVGRG